MVKSEIQEHALPLTFCHCEHSDPQTQKCQSSLSHNFSILHKLSTFCQTHIWHNQPFILQEDLATTTIILPTLAGTLPSQYDILEIVSHIDILITRLSL